MFRNYLNEKLEIAAKAGELTKAETLVKIGADVNLKDSDGGTALMVAAGNGNKDVVEFLVEHGADITLKTEGDRDIVELLRPVKEGIIRVIDGRGGVRGVKLREGFAKIHKKEGYVLSASRC